MELTGTWRARPVDQQAGRSAYEPGTDDSSWASVTVPGHWATEPELGTATGPVMYRRSFEHAAPADGRRSWLVFDGICYLGDVWLDGTYLGDTEGWFFPHRFEITEQLAARSEHVVAVEVSCPEAGPPGERRLLVGALQDPRFVPPGWNPGGLWRPVRILTTGQVPILHFRAVCTSATAERATVRLRAVVHAPEADTVTLRTTIGGHDDEREQPLATGENQVEWEVTIPRPSRWWPRALGEPVLHDLTAEVVLADGTVSDRRTCRIGLRSVRMSNWVMSINGERLFAKGVNVGPTRPDLGNATPEEVRADVEAAQALGLDLLRVHTHVALDPLYDAADELGMLVWQDMPLHGGFVSSARRPAQTQARELVDRLGHHPSVVLWNAHDEPHAPWIEPDSPTGPLLRHQRPTWNRLVLDRSVRRAIRKADPSRPVDLHGGLLPNLSSMDGTDSHLWFGWRGGRPEDLAAFLARLPRAARFVSDFGAWSCSCPPEGRPPADDPAWSILLRNVPRDVFDSDDDWCLATQQEQATVLSTQIEILRRLKYRPTGGFAFSQLADGRGEIGAGVLDRERRPKAAWEAVASVCKPVIVTAWPVPRTATAGDELVADVHVVNDSRVPLGEARVEARALAGEDEVAGRWGWTGTIPADSCVHVGRVRCVVPGGHRALEIELDLVTDEALDRRTYRTTILPAGGRGV